MSTPPNPIGMSLKDYIVGVRADWVARGIASDGGHLAVSVWHYIVKNNPPRSEEDELRIQFAAANGLSHYQAIAGLEDAEKRAYQARADLFITDCRRALSNFLARKRYAEKRALAALHAANTK